MGHPFLHQLWLLFESDFGKIGRLFLIFFIDAKWIDQTYFRIDLLVGSSFLFLG